MLSTRRSCLETARNAILGCFGLSITQAPANSRPQVERNDPSNRAFGNQPQEPGPVKPTEPVEAETNDAEKGFAKPSIADEALVSIHDFPTPTPGATTTEESPVLDPPTMASDLDLDLDRNLDANPNEVAHLGQFLEPSTDEPESMTKSEADPIVDTGDEKLVSETDSIKTTIEETVVTEPALVPEPALEEEEHPIQTKSTELEPDSARLPYLPEEECADGPVLPAVSLGEAGQVN